MSTHILRRGPLVLLIVFVIALYTPLFDHWRFSGDFVAHTVYMERIRDNDPKVFIDLPNYLYHVSVLVPASLFPQTAIADWIVPICVAWFLLLALLIWGQMRGALTEPPNDKTRQPPTLRGEVAAVVLTLIGLFIAPIILFTPDNQYLGYLAPYVYHNPTMIPLRPIAFLIFIGAVSFASSEAYIARVFERRQELRVPLMAALTVASILAKPNFVMIIVPALVIWLVLLRLMRRHVYAQFVIMGIVVPGIAFLAYQSMSYTASGMAFQPFYTQWLFALHYDPNANVDIGLKILLSIAFPLVVTLLYWRQALQSPMLMLIWIATVGGIMLSYLFYDPGEPPAGNLIWSGQIAVMLLHLAALLFLIRRHPWLNAGPAQDLLRFGICAAVLELHVASGVLWYMEHLKGVWPDIIYTVW
jgi:hypothetical protein